MILLKFLLSVAIYLFIGRVIILLLNRKLKFISTSDECELWLYTVFFPIFLIIVLVTKTSNLIVPPLSETEKEPKIPNKEKSCEHLEWDMDNQIRTIKCRSCGKKASVIEYKDLY